MGCARKENIMVCHYIEKGNEYVVEDGDGNKSFSLAESAFKDNVLCSIEPEFDINCPVACKASVE